MNNDNSSILLGSTDIPAQSAPWSKGHIPQGTDRLCLDKALLPDHLMDKWGVKEPSEVTLAQKQPQVLSALILKVPK